MTTDTPIYDALYTDADPYTRRLLDEESADK